MFFWCIGCDISPVAVQSKYYKLRLHFNHYKVAAQVNQIISLYLFCLQVNGNNIFKDGMAIAAFTLFVAHSRVLPPFRHHAKEKHYANRYSCRSQEG